MKYIYSIEYYYSGWRPVGMNPVFSSRKKAQKIIDKHGGSNYSYRIIKREVV